MNNISPTVLLKKTTQKGPTERKHQGEITFFSSMGTPWSNPVEEVRESAVSTHYHHLLVTNMHHFCCLLLTIKRRQLHKRRKTRSKLEEWEDGRGWKDLRWSLALTTWWWMRNSLSPAATIQPSHLSVFEMVSNLRLGRSGSCSSSW